MFKVFIGVVFSSLISSQESGLSAGASTNDVLLLHLLLHLILLLLLLLPFPAAKSGRCAGGETVKVRDSGRASTCTTASGCWECV